LAVDLFADLDAVREAWREDRRFAPGMAADARARKLEVWKRAVERA
jgi:glycerol kinase